MVIASCVVVPSSWDAAMGQKLQVTSIDPMRILKASRRNDGKLAEVVCLEMSGVNTGTSSMRKNSLLFYLNSSSCAERTAGQQSPLCSALGSEVAEGRGDRSGPVPGCRIEYILLLEQCFAGRSVKDSEVGMVTGKENGNGKFADAGKGLLKNKFLNFAPRFGSDLAWLD